MNRVDLSTEDIKKMNMYDYANRLCRENDQFNLIKSEFLAGQLKRDLIAALRSGDDESLGYITEMCKYVELMSRRQYMYTSIMNAISTSVNTYALGNGELARKTKSMIDTFTVQLGKSSGDDLQKFINNFQLQKELKPQSIDRTTTGAPRIIPLHEIMYTKSIEILFDNFVDKTVGVVLLFVEHLKFNACDHDTLEIEKIQKQFEDLKSSHTDCADSGPYTHKYSDLHDRLNVNQSNTSVNQGLDTVNQSNTSVNQGLDTENQSNTSVNQRLDTENPADPDHLNRNEYTVTDVYFTCSDERSCTEYIDSVTDVEPRDVYDYTELSDPANGDDTSDAGTSYEYNYDESIGCDSVELPTDDVDDNNSGCIIDMSDETCIV